ncbi:MAG: site-specific DNA-methyltransferase [Dysgonamonadaceae bacterium]|nr:site-specific DNA-methyltransferase [Dysgonamonadaceae bacterium]
MAKQKLELTWIGKDEEINAEPRILLYDKEKSYGDQNTENMLIHGDNLLALKALEQEYAGKVKCIYIDPPYNTGSAFEHYDDNLEHSIWLGLMKGRLEILRNLLSKEGSIWIQIDDEEQAYLKVLCDEIFGRSNFVNMISVNMKNIAGASGGGEDKRLKKNCEFILIYAKDYGQLSAFKGAYDYEEIGDLVQRYREEGVSWKYTTALVSSGDKVYVGSTVDGEGDEIKIYKRLNFIIKSIRQIMKDESLSEQEAYNKYAHCIFQTAMPQSSIRPRVMKKVDEIGVESELYSIEYTPKTGRNKGQLYEQFYKGANFRLFAWLRDVSEERNGSLYKKTLQGTYWNYIAGTKNLTKEGSIEFPNGKKPESLISRILDMTTEPNDLVLDSFLGSGTTAAVANKMGRRWIGIELGDHCYTHCLPRLQKVVDGEQGGISKDVEWQGGGGFRFYELAPSLLKEDNFGNWIIDNEVYNADLLAAAVAKLNGYYYTPDETTFWKQGKSMEQSYIFTTTQYVTAEYIDNLSKEMKFGDRLLVCCPAFDTGLQKRYDNIIIKKIPQSVLDKCEYGKTDYNLNIIDTDDFVEEDYDELEL